MAAANELPAVKGEIGFQPSRNIQSLKDSPGTSEAAVSEVKIQSPGVSASFLELDLASLDSVKNAAQLVASSSDRLDLLFLNAGIMGHPAALTQDGYEIHFGTNHLGYALLLKLLTTLLVITSHRYDVRVVSLTSWG
ncbi:hypothetical protein F4678DRAFT_455738 [Xylaria arbuscula]|nr:hypothetical protein F4678DRAFT_455738 [Xylaria arbuscula]